MRNLLIGFTLGAVLVGLASYGIAQTPQLDSWRLQQLQQQQQQMYDQQRYQDVQPGGLYGVPRMNQGGSFANPRNPC